MGKEMNPLLPKKNRRECDFLQEKQRTVNATVISIANILNPY